MSFNKIFAALLYCVYEISLYRSVVSTYITFKELRRPAKITKRNGNSRKVLIQLLHFLKCKNILKVVHHWSKIRAHFDAKKQFQKTLWMEGQTKILAFFKWLFMGFLGPQQQHLATTMRGGYPHTSTIRGFPKALGLDA